VFGGSSGAKKDISFLCVFFLSFNNHYMILNINNNLISTEFILVSIPFKFVFFTHLRT